MRSGKNEKNGMRLVKKGSEGLKSQSDPSFSEKTDIKRNDKKKKWKIRSVIFVMLGIFLLTGGASYYILRDLHETAENSRVKRFVILGGQSFKLAPFIIPFKENNQYTYITLSISFTMPNRELMDEIVEKKKQIRGIIYDILTVNINNVQDVSSLNRLKEFIISSVNGVLTAGKIKEAIITGFSVV